MPGAASSLGSDQCDSTPGHPGVVVTDLKIMGSRYGRSARRGKAFSPAATMRTGLDSGIPARYFRRS
jgi:hypothetical protein